jgi:predicted membrane protein (TIGR00267 family)
MFSKKDKDFPILLGFIDGILTALTLCTGKLLEGGGTVDFSLAIRVATAAFITGSFVFFVAKYAELRGQLIRAEKELNIISAGKLASSALGKKTLYLSIIDAIISGISGFIGAFIPLFIAIGDPYPPWITFLFSITTLGIFGYFLGRTVGRSPIIWSISLVFGGILVIFLGIQLHIVN